MKTKTPERKLLFDQCGNPDWNATFKKHVRGYISHRFYKADPALQGKALLISWYRSAAWIRQFGAPQYNGGVYDYDATIVHDVQLETIDTTDVDRFATWLDRRYDELLGDFSDDLFDLSCD